MASPRIKPGRMSKTGSRPYLEALTAPSAHSPFKIAAVVMTRANAGPMLRVDVMMAETTPPFAH